MDYKQKTIITVISLIIIAALALQLKGPEPTKSAGEPRPVKTLTLAETHQGTVHQYPGKVRAIQRVDVSFEEPGQIAVIAVEEGQKINAGDLIAQLDQRNIRAELDKEKARLDLAEVTHARYKALLKKNVVARATYDEKVAALKVAQAVYDQTKKRLEDTTIKAPFSGYVAKKYVEVHEQVGAKQPVVSIQDMKAMEIVIQVPEQDVYQSREAQLGIQKKDDFKKIFSTPNKESLQNQSSTLNKQKELKVHGTVSFPNLPDEAFPVTLKAFQAESDPRTQTFEVTLLSPKPENFTVLPGMTAMVKIKILADDITTFDIPAHAVGVDEKGKHFVWVMKPDTMTVEKKLVTVQNMGEHTVKVTGGLKMGEKIVLAGIQDLEPGMKVLDYEKTKGQ